MREEGCDLFTTIHKYKYTSTQIHKNKYTEGTICGTDSSGLEMRGVEHKRGGGVTFPPQVVSSCIKIDNNNKKTI